MFCKPLCISSASMYLLCAIPLFYLSETLVRTVYSKSFNYSHNRSFSTMTLWSLFYYNRASYNPWTFFPHYSWKDSITSIKMSMTYLRKFLSKFRAFSTPRGNQEPIPWWRRDIQEFYEQCQLEDSLLGRHWGPSAERDRRLPGGFRTDDHLQKLCEAPGCPIRSAHPPGPYFHDPSPCKIWVEVFGCTDPPPELWAAYDRIEAGNGTAADVLSIGKYVEYHGDDTFKFVD